MALLTVIADGSADDATHAGDHIWALFTGSLLASLAVGFLVWFVCACVAMIVAPNDRPWAFFWCTLLFLGPLGIPLALVAPARPVK